MMRAAVHRPAVRRRRFSHDDYIAVDLFSGFGGLTQGIEEAGFTTIMAANHNPYKVEVHEANHPHAEHWIADLVDPESADYHSARDLPAADFLVAGVSCINHSQANTVKAYRQRLTLFDLDDPDFDARVTRSERDRATANCVLHYAERHHPRLILIECTTELASWGAALPGRPKVGDGATYRWWLKQFSKLGYRHRVLYLNSMFFGVPQSRDRLYIAFWDRRLPTPDLDHRPPSWCGHCQKVTDAVWTWRTGVPATGSVRYGKQYNYRCPACRSAVTPPMAPSLNALDLTNLGTRIGDKPVRTFKDGSTGPLAASTMARAERCRQRFAEFPPVLVPAQATAAGSPWQPMAGQVIAAHRHNGDGQPITRPMDTVTATHEKATLLASPGAALATAVDNYQGVPRGPDEPLPTQAGSETLGLLTARILPNRTNGTSRNLGEPTETVVGNAGSGGLGVLSAGLVPYRSDNQPVSPGQPLQTISSHNAPGLLTAAGTIKHNGPASEATYRAHPVSDPLGTVVGSAITQGLLFSGWYKQNGSQGTETAPHPLSDPFGTLTARDTTAVLTAAEGLPADWQGAWRELISAIKLEDCYIKMLSSHEVGRGCGFDVDFDGYGYKGTFRVWGSARAQVDGFGNAVSPPVGAWIGTRLRAILDTPQAVA